jgi:RimJ/RimL family protein N-acetyltransferase
LNPRLHKAARVTGHKLQFRNAGSGDAAFILRLRTDADKARHLSAVSGSLAAQEAWLDRYAADRDQAYFIIEDRAARPVGTVRLYDPQGESFCWGSWIKDDAAPSSFAVESALMVYRYGQHRGFTASHFDVRIDNDKVWAFHERLGARRVKTTELDHHYVMDAAAIQGALANLARWLPNGISVVEL